MEYLVNQLHLLPKNSGTIPSTLSVTKPDFDTFGFYLFAFACR
jgi:hypothetical protein